MNKVISSLQNPLVKQLILLQNKSRERKKSGVFVVEGVREIKLALKGKFAIKTLILCPAIFSEKIDDFSETVSEIIEITEEVYHKIAYRTSTEGILAIAKSKDVSLKNFQLKNKNPLLLIAEAPEKPGNIGALLRTADAANLDAVFIANPKTDLYNPNIIRSSVGCVFTNTIVMGTTSEIIAFLQENKIYFYAATLQNSNVYHEIDYTVPSAIVVGTEATGLSEVWRTKSTKNILIPMEGEIDSMNVSVAAGILIFEAKRQRTTNS
ncbi:TrmH family RNA methyltransferase [Jejudonia soesokkakensis]|uniref:TrmH family RNA methyltransferase n=1 Tax=Jejudonia soesokkakensis TaxID=1323432 RepID=A0ABW2MXI1_9FLAO